MDLKYYRIHFVDSKEVEVGVIDSQRSGHSVTFELDS